MTELQKEMLVKYLKIIGGLLLAIALLALFIFVPGSFTVAVALAFFSIVFYFVGYNITDIVLEWRLRGLLPQGRMEWLLKGKELGPYKYSDHYENIRRCKEIVEEAQLPFPKFHIGWASWDEYLDR